MDDTIWTAAQAKVINELHQFRHNVDGGFDAVQQQANEQAARQLQIAARLDMTEARLNALDKGQAEENRRVTKEIDLHTIADVKLCSRLSALEISEGQTNINRVVSQRIDKLDARIDGVGVRIGGVQVFGDELAHYRDEHDRRIGELEAAITGLKNAAAAKEKPPEPGETLARAKLMAVAPTLAAALQGLLAKAETPSSEPGWISLIRDAKAALEAAGIKP